MELEPLTEPTRLGVVLPGVNTVVESWYPAVLPSPVHLAVNRMHLDARLTPEALAEMDQNGVVAAGVLGTCRPAALLYACTASSIARGRDYDLELTRELTRAAGAPSITTMGSALQALGHLGVGTVAIASPYTEDLGKAEGDFLRSSGYRVSGEAHLGIETTFDLASPSAEQIVALGRAAMADASLSVDALFIGCMNLNAHLVIETLEADLGVPVVTATSASLWAALRTVGVDAQIEGYGALLSGAAR